MSTTSCWISRRLRSSRLPRTNSASRYRSSTRTCASWTSEFRSRRTTCSSWASRQRSSFKICSWVFNNWENLLTPRNLESSTYKSSLSRCSHKSMSTGSYSRFLIASKNIRRSRRSSRRLFNFRRSFLKPRARTKISWRGLTDWRSWRKPGELCHHHRLPLGRTSSLTDLF